MTTVNYTRHNTVQRFDLVPGHWWIAPPYVGMETHMGPWGWQWGGGVRTIVSVPPPSVSITIKALVEDIEKDAPGMCRTITDSAYSLSPECPFLIDEISMANFRSNLYKYENEKALISPDAQIGVRKSIAAALGERKSSMQDGGIRAVFYPCSVDIERLVDSLCGLRLPLDNISADEHDRGSGTMSMDLGTEDEDETPLTPPDMPSLPKAVRSKVHGEVVCVGIVDGSPGVHL